MCTKLILLTVLAIHGACQAVELFVTNGHEALPHQYPYQVAIYSKLPIIGKEHLACSGVILTSSWVLTAAQCVPKIASLTVKAGKHNITTDEPGQEVRQVKLYVKHSDYVSSGWFKKIPENNIALLKLKTPLTFNKNVQPIELPKSGAKHTGIGFLTGWGERADGNEAQVLQAVKVPFVDSDSCTEVIRSVYKKEVIHENQICTGPIGEDISACTGDIGDPVVQFQGNGKPQLVGIVSWFHTPCAEIGLPTVYTRVSSYIDWINEKILSL